MRPGEQAGDGGVAAGRAEAGEPHGPVPDVGAVRRATDGMAIVEPVSSRVGVRCVSHSPAA